VGLVCDFLDICRVDIEKEYNRNLNPNINQSNNKVIFLRAHHK